MVFGSTPFVAGSEPFKVTGTVSETENSRIVLEGIPFEKLHSFCGIYTGAFPESFGDLGISVSVAAKSGEGKVLLGYWLNGSETSLFGENFTEGTYTYENGTLTVTSAWHFIEGGTYEFTVTGE